jgi:hypothetical protein
MYNGSCYGLIFFGASIHDRASTRATKRMSRIPLLSRNTDHGWSPPPMRWEPITSAHHMGAWARVPWHASKVQFMERQPTRSDTYSAWCRFLAIVKEQRCAGWSITFVTVQHAVVRINHYDGSPDSRWYGTGPRLLIAGPAIAAWDAAEEPRASRILSGARDGRATQQNQAYHRAALAIEDGPEVSSSLLIRVVTAAKSEGETG